MGRRAFKRLSAFIHAVIWFSGGGHKVKDLPKVAKLRFTAPAEDLGDRSRKCLKD